MSQTAQATAQRKPLSTKALRVQVAAVADDQGDAMCRVRTEPPVNRLTGALTYSAFVGLLDDLPKLREVTLQGTGEPLLVPNLVEMVKTATRRGVQVTVESNATLLYRDRSEALVEAGLHRLRVLMDGVNQYDDALTATAFGPTLENLAGFTAARRAAGTSTPEVEVVFLASSQNLAQLPDLVALLSGIWVRQMRVDYRAPLVLLDPLGFVSDKQPPRLNRNTARKVFAVARRTAVEYGLPLVLPVPGVNTPPHDNTPYVTCAGLLRTCHLAEAAA